MPDLFWPFVGVASIAFIYGVLLGAWTMDQHHTRVQRQMREDHKGQISEIMRRGGR